MQAHHTSLLSLKRTNFHKLIDPLHILLIKVMRAHTRTHRERRQLAISRRPWVRAERAASQPSRASSRTEIASRIDTGTGPRRTRPSYPGYHLSAKLQQMRPIIKSSNRYIDTILSLYMVYLYVPGCSMARRRRSRLEMRLSRSSMRAASTTAHDSGSLIAARGRIIVVVTISSRGR